MTHRPILITGAAGKTGRAILEALAGIDRPVRAMVRRREQVEPVRAMGAREVVVGDLLDATALERAVAGSGVVYHICPNASPDEEAIGQKIIAACERAGANRLVYHSVLQPQIEAMPHHWAKLRVEELLLGSGLAFSILQPAAYMQNVLAHRESIVEQGVYPVPFAPETRVGMVDLRDVAAVAARVLTEEGHEGATYELAADGAPTQIEIAELLGAALGREVRLEVVDRDEWASAARAGGLGEYSVNALVAMFRYYESHGFQGNPKVLGWLLGRAPRNFSEFILDVFKRPSAR